MDVDETPDMLAKVFGLGSPDQPFPWQANLLTRFKAGEVPDALDVPTGLGKMAVMGIWLVTRAGSRLGAAS